jgi:phenylalanyl-tRNA synthetase beta chain
MLVPYDWLKEFVPVDLPPRKLADRLTMLGPEVGRIGEVEGGTVFDISVTSNRGDCLSVLGIAREVAAALGLPLRPPPVGERAHPGAEIPQPVLSACRAREAEGLAAIEIAAPDMCPRYSAAIVLGTRAIPSPEWAQRRLRQCGVRPINALVDVTNLVMLELGQPLHAFDYDLLSKDESGRARIIVRRAEEGERLQTLDGVDRILSSEMPPAGPGCLVIADRKGAVALAGIMGGARTEVTEGTRAVLIESAHFDRIAIRRASRALGLASESSYRFERIVDPGGTVRAAQRAAQLMVEFAGGQVARGVLDEWPIRVEPTTITVRPRRINQVLGTRISPGQMAQYLRALGLEVEDANQALGGAKSEIPDSQSAIPNPQSEIGNPKSEIRNLRVTVPSFRADLTQEIDVAEEIARLHGYDKIRLKLAPSPVRGRLSPELQLEQRLRSLLLGLGLTETRTFSLDSPSVFDKLSVPERHHLRNAPTMRNPKSEEYSILRTTLLGSLLATIRTNVSRGLDDVHIFEIGRVYLRARGASASGGPAEAKQPVEKRALGIAMRGSPWTSPWNVSPGATAYSDFFALKGIVEQVVACLTGRKVQFSGKRHPSMNPGLCAAVLVNGSDIGIMGEVRPDVLEAFDIPPRSVDEASGAATGGVFLAGVDLDALFGVAMQPEVRVASPLSRFPALRRDIALVVPDEIQASRAEEVIRDRAGQILERISLFDMYRGEQLPPGHKNLAFSLVFRHPDRTLTDGEIEEIMTRIRDALVEQLGAKIREW